MTFKLKTNSQMSKSSKDTKSKGHIGGSGSTDDSTPIKKAEDMVSEEKNNKKRKYEDFMNVDKSQQSSVS